MLVLFFPFAIGFNNVWYLGIPSSNTKYIIILYSLKSVVPNAAQDARLNAVHVKVLRQIVDI